LDLTVEVPALAPDTLSATADGEGSATIRVRVIAARERQLERYAADRVRMNAELTPSWMSRYCALDRAGAI